MVIPPLKGYLGGELLLDRVPEASRHHKRTRSALETEQVFQGGGEGFCAMQASWQAALPLPQLPALTRVLGERHRIIVNDWQAAQQSSLISMVNKRALEIVERVDFAPSAVRTDLAGPRVLPAYLYAAAELLSRAADIASESAILTYDNERRWRVFHQQLQQVLAESANRAGAYEDAQQAPEG